MFERPTGLTFEAALRDIRASRPKDRVAAADLLGDVKTEEQQNLAFEALAEAIGDSRPEVRTIACFSLAALGREEAWEIIALCLTDAVPETRQAAAIALGTLKANDSLPALLQALEEGPNDLRFQAASSLVEVDAEAAYAPLLQALEDNDDSEVLGAIALGLGSIGNAACADTIATLLDQNSSQTRLDAAYALAQFSDPRAIDTLAAALSDKHGGWDAVCAMQKLGPSTIPKLMEFLDRGTGAVSVKLKAAGAILALATQDTDAGLAQRTLADGLKERKVEMRGLAIELLEKHGGSWALEPLQHCRQTRRGRGLHEEIDAALAAITARNPLP